VIATFGKQGKTDFKQQRTYHIGIFGTSHF
jgi:hypothetical protein